MDPASIIITLFFVFLTFLFQWGDEAFTALGEARIRELEEETATSIFVRKSRGVLLTPEGAEFLGHARQGVQQAALTSLSASLRMFPASSSTPSTSCSSSCSSPLPSSV